MPPARLQVRLRLLPTSEGGRHRGISDNYRCQWRSERKPEWNDAMVHIESDLAPGDETDASLVLAVPTYWDGTVEVGDVLEGGEGSRVVATAEVRIVLHA